MAIFNSGVAKTRFERGKKDMQQKINQQILLKNLLKIYIKFTQKFKTFSKD